MASKAKTTVTFHSGIHDQRHRHRSGIQRCPYFLRFLVQVSPQSSHYPTKHYRPWWIIAGSHRCASIMILVMYLHVSWIRTKDFKKTAVFHLSCPIFIIQRWSSIWTLPQSLLVYLGKETKAILKALNRTGDFLIPTPHEALPLCGEMWLGTPRCVDQSW